MSGFNLAVVVKVLPEKHGILVSYRNGVEHRGGMGSGSNQAFVRVLERRAHSHGGTTLCLPEPGELGLVAEVEPGMTVWMGSLPWDEQNQMDPRPGLEAWRHPSGVEVLCTEDGDFQLSHPSGFCLTLAALDGAQVPRLQGSTPLDQRYASGGDFPHLILNHPSGFVAHLDSIGNLKIDSPAALEANIAGTVVVTTQSSASLTAVGPISATTQSTLSASAAGNATVHTDTNLAASAGGNVEVTASGTAKVTSGGSCTLKASAITLDGPVTCTSTLQVTSTAQVGGALFAQGGITTLDGSAVPGNFWITGQMKSATALIGGKNFAAHTHSDPQGGTTGAVS